MSIRLIARELYQLIREIESLEKRLESVPLEQQASIQDRLRRLRAERNRMRGALEGSKHA